MCPVDCCASAERDQNDHDCYALGLVSLPVEPEAGIEPATYRLRGDCSATELLRRTDATIDVASEYARPRRRWPSGEVGQRPPQPAHGRQTTATSRTPGGAVARVVRSACAPHGRRTDGVGRLVRSGGVSHGRRTAGGQPVHRRCWLGGEVGLRPRRPADRRRWPAGEVGRRLPRPAHGGDIGHAGRGTPSGAVTRAGSAWAMGG